MISALVAENRPKSVDEVHIIRPYTFAESPRKITAWNLVEGFAAMFADRIVLKNNRSGGHTKKLLRSIHFQHLQKKSGRDGDIVKGAMRLETLDQISVGFDAQIISENLIFV